MNNKLRYRYDADQLDLACLDTKQGDHREYGECLAFAWRSSALEALEQMFDANGGLTFDNKPIGELS